MQTAELTHDVQPASIAPPPEHLLRSLRDAAFAVITPFIASVDDEVWDRVFGLRAAIHGGCELLVDNDRLELVCEGIELGTVHMSPRLPVPVIVNDPYFPMLKAVVLLGDLQAKCNRLKHAHAGPHHARGRSRCVHRPYPNSTPGCLSCAYNFWQGRAKELGLSLKRAK